MRTRSPAQSKSKLAVILAGVVSFTVFSQLALMQAAAGGDTTKPTTPTELSLTSEKTSVNVTWQPSTDDVAVTGYDLVRTGGDGTTNRRIVGTSVIDKDLKPDTKYTYKVKARDAASNESGYTKVASITTQKDDSTEPPNPADPDTEKPTVPTEVVASASGKVVTLSWKASTDNVGVTTYEISRTGGTGGAKTFTTNGTFFSDSATAFETKYTYTIAAKDAAGNLSAKSSPVPVTTGTEKTGTKGSMLGGDPREDSIYFVMTARFADGDATNNRGGSQHIKSGNAANDDPMFRGDFKGLVDNLDYIKGLGFSAIWITPVVTNRSDYDFHGYHGWDFYNVDPRLESEGASYQELIDAAHAKGIKIYQDVIYNHSSRWGGQGSLCANCLRRP